MNFKLLEFVMWDRCNKCIYQEKASFFSLYLFMGKTQKIFLWPQCKEVSSFFFFLVRNGNKKENWKFALDTRQLVRLSLVSQFLKYMQFFWFTFIEIQFIFYRPGNSGSYLLKVMCVIKGSARIQTGPFCCCGLFRYQQKKRH